MSFPMPALIMLFGEEAVQHMMGSAQHNAARETGES